MKTMMYIYAGLLLLLSLGNLGFWFKKGGKNWFLIYETLSGVVLAGAIFVYFTPEWFAIFPYYGLIPVVLVVAVDVYLSLRGDFGREAVELFSPGDLASEELGEADWDTAEMVSLILVSPGYLCAMLLVIDKLKIFLK